MNRFFFLNNEYNTKNVGTLPQVEKYYDGFHMLDPFAFWKEADTSSILKATGIRLKYHAKATDLIETLVFNPTEVMLISNRFFELLQSFQCIPWIRADAEVAHRQKSHPYKLLRFPTDEQSYLDYNKTIFFMTDPAGYWDRDFKLSDQEDYLSFKHNHRIKILEAVKRGEQYAKFEIKELHIVDHAPDFFVIRPISKVVVSERLKNAIEEANLTGVIFSPTSDYKPLGLKMPKQTTADSDIGRKSTTTESQPPERIENNKIKPIPPPKPQKQTSAKFDHNYHYLSPETQTWLQNRDDLKFSEYFTNLATSKKDRKWREAAMEIAAQWCMLQEAGLDGKALHPTLKDLIEPFAEKPSKDGPSDPVEWLWSNMCAHCAEYRFAQIDEFDLTRALYGIYRSLLPEVQDVEPFDEMIIEKLASALGVDRQKVPKIGYAIRNNGLMSEVILFPPLEAKGWTDYADQYRIKLLGT